MNENGNMTASIPCPRYGHTVTLGPPAREQAGIAPVRERVYLVSLIAALAIIARLVGGWLSHVGGSNVAGSVLYGVGSFTGSVLLALAIIATIRRQ